MKIKRYFGKNIRQAIQRVREEQGPDAVILSNRKVEGGVEIVAAIDFDEVLLDADAPTNPALYQPSVTKTIATGGTRASRSSVRASPTASRSGAAASAPTKGTTDPGNQRSVDPALLDMRRELKNLRGLLEQQISGLVFGDVARRHPLQANLLRLLLQLEVSPKLCQQIVAELSASTDATQAWRNALGVLAHKLPVTDDDILTHGGVVALIGPTGVGKTTTAAKLAARYAVRHGSRRVALVTTDNYRIGAHEQLRAYAKILDVPLRVASDHNELGATLKDLSDRQLVLIDTAGMSQRDLRLSEQFAMIRAGSSTVKSYLVMSATTREAGLDEVIRTYKRIPLSGCILTKVDEAGSLGGVLSLLISHGLPVAYVSDGQRVPEDLYTARAHQLVSRSVAMMRRGTQTSERGPMTLALGEAVTHAS